MKLSKCKDGLHKCKNCKDHSLTIDMFSHPTWTDGEGNIHYTIPQELQGLRERREVVASTGISICSFATSSERKLWLQGTCL